MRPAMTDAETAMLESFLSKSQDYFEFGAGGSTCSASRLVQKTITTLDNSLEWLMRARESCERQGTLLPLIKFADVGPVKELGFPKDERYRNRWPSYPKAVLTLENRSEIDTFLVDGRFRVACFAATMLVARSDAVILVHDYGNRPVYDVMATIGRMISSSDNLAAFVKSPGMSAESAERVLHDYLFDPA